MSDEPPRREDKGAPPASPRAKRGGTPRESAPAAENGRAAEQTPLPADAEMSPTESPPSAPDDRGIAQVADERGVAQTPDERGVAQTPDERGVPQTPDERGIPQTPDERGVPQTPDERGVAHAPAEGGISQTPAERGVAQTPAERGVPQTPDERGVAQAPDERGVAQTPDERGVPQTPDERGVAQAPDECGKSQTPDERGVTQVPDERGVPQTPAERGVAQTPDERGVAQTPDERGIPQTPDERGVPQTPDERGVPQEPAERGVAQVPAERGVAQAPDERGVPQVPAVTIYGSDESAAAAIGVTSISTPVTAEPELPTNVAILPSRVAVLYPGMLLPFLVSAQPWVRLLSDAVSARQPIGLFLQRDPAAAVTELSALHQVGTAANIVRLLKLPDGSLQVLLQGAARIRLDGPPTQTTPYLRADIVVIPPQPEHAPTSMEVEGLVRNLQASFQRVVQLSPVLPEEMAIAAANVDEPGRLADFVAANTDIESPQRQEILEELDPLVRARKVTELVTRELEVLAIGSKIQSQIRESMDKTQRDFYLRQQLQAIRKELGETDENEVALDDLRTRLAKAGLSEEASKQADREIDRLASIPTASPEHSMVRTYLEWIADLPWGIVTEDNLDVRNAKRVLDEDHFDLDRVKDRILEFLAVMKLRAERDAAEATRVRGAILCLVGPPGVGKTSLGQSIGRALGRKFVHMSLGGVRDEAEIRGHRRTYIGALPGRIIQALRRAGSRNPVFILDEIDKVGSDWRGDPSSALLEVLDPAQNSDFRDHYLDLSFDLSSVLFIATANVLDTVPPALRDRLEVIDLPGYTEDDKLQIARRYLVPRQLPENGLAPDQVRISDAALRRIIRDYTREAGVRNLERAIATVARKSARTIVLGDATSIAVTHRSVAELLGPPRFQQEVSAREDEVGVATGLAYTPSGGEVLFVEARVVPGKGNLLLTGQLGDVMKESAQAALTFARARGQALGLGADDPLAERDIHVHVPAGAVPKDGPSAGITMATAIISALTRRPVDHTVGMTGEITLRGRVLPIGGLKEKVLAAHRAGLTHLIVPRDNRRDLEEIPARVRKEITFTFVDHMDQVLNVALKREIQPERSEVKPLSRPSRRRGETVAAAPK